MQGPPFLQTRLFRAESLPVPLSLSVSFFISALASPARGGHPLSSGASVATITHRTQSFPRKNDCWHDEEEEEERGGQDPRGPAGAVDEPRVTKWHNEAPRLRPVARETTGRFSCSTAQPSRLSGHSLLALLSFCHSFYLLLSGSLMNEWTGYKLRQRKLRTASLIRDALFFPAHATADPGAPR